MSVKRISIITLSVIALIVAAFWVKQSGATHEPVIALLLGLSGLIGQLFIDKPKEDEAKPVKNENKNENKTGKQNTTVNVNVGSAASEDKKHDIVSNNVKSEKVNKREEKLQILKQKVGVLFIDDKKFNIVKILKDAGWKKTKSVTDIKSLDETKVKEALIYFVDINGVGKILECKGEGLDIALMLKQKYPNRKVVIYSANPKNEVFHEAWEHCDHKLIKNALPYEYQSLVENFSLELEQNGHI